MSHSNPLDDRWQWVESARKDREAAVSQWKAERQKREQAEASRDALAKALREALKWTDTWFNAPLEYFNQDTAAEWREAMDAWRKDARALVGSSAEGLSGE